MSEIIFVSKARLSFPKLVEPSAFEAGGALKFSCDLIIDPNGRDWQQVISRAMEVAQLKWKEHANQVVNMINQDRKIRFYGQGAEKINKQTYRPYDGYPGMVYISCSSDYRPQMVRANGSTAESDMEIMNLARKLYGGCYVNAAIKIWAQDNKWGRGLRCECVAIQFDQDGEPFGDNGPVNVDGIFGQATQATSTTAGMDAPGFGAQGFGAPGGAQGFGAPPQSQGFPSPGQSGGFPPPQGQPQGFSVPQQNNPQQGYPPMGMPSFMK